MTGPIAALGDAEWAAVYLSLKVAFWATVGSLPVALFVAHALARWRFPGRQVLNLLVHLPLVLPPVVTGYLLLLALGRTGWLGGALYDLFGVTFAFRWTGAALAGGVMAFPLMVRAMRLALESVDSKLEEAAATLGAGPVRVYVTVTLPLIVPGIAAGAVLAFAKAMGEFGATITFVSNIPGQTRTIPTAIYSLLQTPGSEPAVLWLIVVSIAISALALVGSEWLTQRASRAGRAQAADSTGAQE